MFGATGLVGQTLLKVLEEKNLPIDEYIFFASSKSKGKKITLFNNEYTVQELTENSFDEHIDFAIFSAGGDISKKFAPIASEKGCTVIDNSSAFRMDKNVPLVVPEVNPEEIFNHKGIISNPNCSTIQAVVALKPLDDHYNIKRIVYSTYQAVSGAGYSGIIDFKSGFTNFDIDKEMLFTNNTDCPYPLLKFHHPIFNNCLPHIDVFLKNGYTKEEEKMINETRKILKKPDLKVTATTVRVPVLNCHSESINVEFEKDFDLDEAINILCSSHGITVKNDFSNEIYPTVIDSCGKDEVFVGRIRKDESLNSGLNLWVVSDNLRKGAATNAIQILEKLLA